MIKICKICDKPMVLFGYGWACCNQDCPSVGYMNEFEGIVDAVSNTMDYHPKINTCSWCGNDLPFGWDYDLCSDCNINWTDEQMEAS